MVIKVYLSGLSGSKEIKKRQQRVLLLLDTAKVKYEAVDITEPGKEEVREFLQKTCKKRDNKSPTPPQFFNDDVYCGDYEDFELAADVDKLFSFLKIEADSSQDDIIIIEENAQPKSNGDLKSARTTQDEDEDEEESKEENDKGEDVDSGNADSYFGNDGNGKSVDRVQSKPTKESGSDNDELQVDLDQSDTMRSEDGEDELGLEGSLKRKSKEADEEKVRDAEEVKKQKVYSDAEQEEEEEVEEDEADEEEEVDATEKGEGEKPETEESSAKIDEDKKESDVEDVEDEPELEEPEPDAEDEAVIKPKSLEITKKGESEDEEVEEDEEDEEEEVESE